MSDRSPMGECLANIVAHEAMHEVADTMFWSEVKGGNRTSPLDGFIEPMIHRADDLSIAGATNAGMVVRGAENKGGEFGHNWVIPATDACVTCRK
jgi:hypothetical protein